MLATDGSAVMLHATDSLAEAIEQLQFTLGEGPCVDASASGAPVLVGDLDNLADRESGRWPMFLREARRVGVQALFAFPVRVGTVDLGTVDLYRRIPGELTDRQLTEGMAAVDQIGSRMLDLRPAESAESAESAEASYPMTVHQATGMVMVQLGTTIEASLARLRAAAFAEDMSVVELASEVLAGRRRFNEEDV